MRDGRLGNLVRRLPDRTRTRGALVGLASLGAAALAVGIILGTGLTSSSQGASPAGKVSGATTVQRRNLVATDTESGTLTYADPQTVYNRISGTVTWLPTVGQLIKPGHALYYVDNQPVTLFRGHTPAYRDLASGISNGPDIKELNQDLVNMGFDSSHQITLNDAWQTGTTDAINRWQSSLGESQTGSITLGQVVFLPSAQRVTTVDAVLGATGSSSGSAGSGSSSGSGTGSSSSTAGTNDPSPQFASLETTTTTPKTPTTPATTPSACAPSGTGSGTTPSKKGQRRAARACGKTDTTAALLALLKAETLELQKSLSSSSGGRTGSPSGGKSAGGAGSAGAGASGSGASGAGSSGSSGSGSGSGATAEPILATTSNQLNVVVDLDATKQSEATLGEPVTVQMPDGSTVNGKITAVSPIAQNSSSSSGSGSGSGSSSGGSSSTPSATIPVTIAVHGNLPASGLDQAAVSVNFEQQVENNVLSVPVTALLATAGGGYSVQEAAAPHRVIPVTPGLFAAGYVQISGAQIYPGLQVTDSQG